MKDYAMVLNKSRRAMSLTQNKNIGLFLSKLKERKSNFNSNNDLK